jgi:tRNA threonylcarbamoyl adenosine modification protein YjeE
VIADLDALAAFAREFLEANPDGVIAGLRGDLGAGKTTFVRSCVAEICRRRAVPVPRVVSPSYTIQQSYRELQPPVEHFDLYRLETLGPEELVELGYYEAVADCEARRGFVFVEWPERAASADALALQTVLHFSWDGHTRSVSAEKPEKLLAPPIKTK